MLAVGYSEASQAFIVRNSWGEDWVGCTKLVHILYVILLFVTRAMTVTAIFHMHT
jgi:hypothetical protein